MLEQKNGGEGRLGYDSKTKKATLRRPILFFNGGRGTRVEELFALGVEYPVQWRESKVNLAELAKLRWINGWSRQQIAVHYGKTFYAIAKYCVTAKKKDFDFEGLTSAEKEFLRQKFSVRSKS